MVNTDDGLTLEEFLHTNLPLIMVWASYTRLFDGF